MREIVTTNSRRTPPATAATTASRTAQTVEAVYDPLTEREIEVLSHLRLRRKPKEIAQLLCLSEATVRTHIRNAIRGLGVHGARAAVRAAHDLQLLDPPHRVEFSEPAE